MYAISQSLSLWPLDIFVSDFLNWFHCASLKSINNKSKKKLCIKTINKKSVKVKVVRIDYCIFCFA